MIWDNSIAKKSILNFLLCYAKTIYPLIYVTAHHLSPFLVVLGFIYLFGYYKELLNEQSEIKLKEVYNSFKNQPFIIMFDETKDREQQNVLNILIGKVG